MTASRGNVMVQVLLMAVLLLSLATGLLKMYMQHHNAGVFAVSSTRTRSRVETSIAAAHSAWSVTGTCTNGAGVSCTAGPGYSGPAANNACRAFPIRCYCNVSITTSGGTVLNYPQVFVCRMGAGPNDSEEVRVLTDYSLQ